MPIRMRMIPQRRLTAFIGLICFVLSAWGGGAAGETPHISVSAHISAYDYMEDGSSDKLYYATSTGGYSIPNIKAQLRELGVALHIYAYDHEDYLPPSLSLLYTEGYVDDPCWFWNPGDSDPAPDDITNDVPDAPDSAQISFEYFGAGLRLNDLNGGMIVIRDNAAVNNCGLGYISLYGDFSTEFAVVEDPIMSSIEVGMDHCATSYIVRGDSNSEPYAFPDTGGAVVEAGTSLHEWDMHIEGGLTQSVLDAFAVEGFGDSNHLSYSATALAYAFDVSLDGPEGDYQPMTGYFGFETWLSSEISLHGESIGSSVQLQWSESSAGAIGDVTQINFNKAGTIFVGDYEIIEARILQPGEDGYFPGRHNIYMRGIMPATIDIPVNTDGTYNVFINSTCTFPATPESSPGASSKGAFHYETPVTPDMSKVRLFAPAGYEFAYRFAGEPETTACYLRGDANLDGEIDAADKAAFVAAFTGSKKDPAYAETDFESLATFDFDNDADVDCDDFAAFAEAWTGGGSAGTLPQCIPAPRYLTVHASEAGDVRMDPPGGVYANGDSVELTATSQHGWKFAGWAGDVESTDPVVSVVMDADKEVLAKFESVCTGRLAPLDICQPANDPEGLQGSQSQFGCLLTGPQMNADAFTPAETTFVDGIRWYGFSHDLINRPAYGADDFTITFYEDSNGWPGDVVAEINGANADFTRALTGIMLPELLGYDPVYPELEYTARLHDSLTLAGGQTYWIQIINEPAPVEGSATIWMWRVSDSGDNMCLSDQLQNGYDSDDVNDYDFAFCLLEETPLESPGDINRDGVVNLNDLAHLLGRYGQSGFGPDDGDIDGDCDVDLDDLAALLAYYGNVYP